MSPHGAAELAYGDVERLELGLDLGAELLPLVEFLVQPPEDFGDECRLGVCGGVVLPRMRLDHDHGRIVPSQCGREEFEHARLPGTPIALDADGYRVELLALQCLDDAGGDVSEAEQVNGARIVRPQWSRHPCCCAPSH
jgi:hypothetical protein